MTIAAGRSARVNGDPEERRARLGRALRRLPRFYAYDRTPLKRASRRSTTARPTGARRRSASMPHTAASAFPRISSCRRTRRRHTRRSCSSRARTPGQRRSSQQARPRAFDFIVRSGRALFYPVYQGTFERRRTTPLPARAPCATRRYSGRRILPRRRLPRDAHRYRHQPARLLQPEHGRVLRSDPGRARPRIKVAVFAAGGLGSTRPRDPAGQLRPARQGAGAAHQRPGGLLQPARGAAAVLELLGTPAEHKRHAVLEGGHAPADIRGLIRESDSIGWTSTGSR